MAAGLAAELKEANGIEAELIAGKSGIFLVEVDGEKLFSRRENDPPRFPALGEISAAIKARQEA